MTPLHEFQDIARFLRARGHTSLFGYYSVDENSPNDVVSDTIDERRRWAQGQQANRKTGAEARWLIQNHALVRRTLLERREEYLSAIRQEAAERHAEHLRTFIRGAMHGGQFAREAEREVRKLAAGLRVPSDFVESLIVELIEETGAIRRSKTIDPETSALLSRVQEVLAEGLLPTSELDRILKRGTETNLEPKVIVRKIDDAIREHQVDANARSAETVRREEARRTAVWNVVAAVRGLAMAGALGLSTARALERESMEQGLDLKTADALIQEALRLEALLEMRQVDPWNALGMPYGTDKETLRTAYVELRRIAGARSDVLSAAKAVIRLDLAWARLRSEVE